PGEELVNMCYEAGIEVTSLPGAAACITALTLSGLSTRRFAFEAFLPTDKKEKLAVLKELERETRTMVLYEAPHRLIKTLKELLEILGNRRMTVCRELTKKFEIAFVTTIEEAILYYEEKTPKGECVLVLEGKSREQIQQENQEKWETMSIEAHVEHYMQQGIDKKEAMRVVAKDRGIGKREVYQALI
ncbi:MAG: SAM-dependent methyltransferase, partial [Lachnospiraceae bacterium]